MNWGLSGLLLTFWDQHHKRLHRKLATRPHGPHLAMSSCLWQKLEARDYCLVEMDQCHISLCSCPVYTTSLIFPRLHVLCLPYHLCKSSIGDSEAMQNGWQLGKISMSWISWQIKKENSDICIWALGHKGSISILVDFHGIHTSKPNG